MHTQVEPAREVETRGPRHLTGARRTGQGRWVLRFAAFALSVTAASVGAGLCLPRLGNEGTVPAAWFGLALLVTGLALAAWSGWRLLTGWWVPSSNGAAVALLHGAGSTRTAVLDHAEVLADAGYGVLLVDARGHGESGGRGMDFGWYGERDASAAVDFLVSRAVVAEGATNRVAAVQAFLDAYGAGHVRGLETEPDAWQRHVLDFLDSALIAGRPRANP